MGADILLLVLLMSLAGSALGTFTGLVPGIHVNTLAAVMLASYPAISSAIGGLAPPGCVPVMVSACIVSASVVHSFVDFIPSVFIGAPDADEALTMLPGHRLLMEGRGMAAVRAAAVGSAVGAFLSVLLSVPFQYLMIKGLAEIMDEITLFVVLTVSFIVICSASGLRDRLLAASVFVASGLLGLACSMAGIPSSGILGEGTLLFPMLTGLFGIPPLLESAKSAGIPEQEDGGGDVGVVPGLKGVLTGCLAGWFPGITATAGAAVSSAVSKEDCPERFISLVASIGTVTSVFSIVTLSVTGSGRSGTSAVIKEIIGDGLDGFCSSDFLLLLLAVCSAAAVGYAIALVAGKGMSGIAGSIDAGKMNRGALLLVLSLVFLMTGPGGLAVLAVSSLLGLVPQREGVSRIPLTGCLMLPVIVSGLGIL